MAGTLHLTAASSSWLQPKASRLKWHSVRDFSNPEHCTSFMWTGPIPGERQIRQNINVKKEFFTTVVHFLNHCFYYRFFIVILKKRAVVHNERQRNVDPWIAQYFFEAEACAGQWTQQLKFGLFTHLAKLKCRCFCLLELQGKGKSSKLCQIQMRHLRLVKNTEILSPTATEQEYLQWCNFWNATRDSKIQAAARGR